MKRVGNLYQKICSIENCRAAILTASRRKRRRRNVTRILGSLDHYAKILQKLLRDHLWEPAPYSVRYINDGIRLKRRRLAKPRFWPDQCIHHALDRVMESVIMKGMDYYCCGSVRGRGAARAKKGLTRWIRRKPRLSKYVFKMDIHKYFDSISHEELMAVLRRKVKDPEVLELYQKILDSYDAVDPEVSTEEHEIFRKGYGIPIGIDPSRWLCNLFLEGLDHWIRRFLGRNYFFTRYVDDIVVVGPNKRKLHKLRKGIEDFLGRISLRIKANWQVFRLQTRPIDFLGFKFYKDGHLEIRKTILKRIKRKAAKVGQMARITFRNATGMISYMGYVKGADSQFFYATYITKKIKIKRLRRIISHEGKIQREAESVLARSA